MSLYHTPYIWLPRTIHKNVISYFKQTIYGLRNLYKFLPLVWKNRDWDYVYLLDLMEFKFLHMAEAFERGVISHDPKNIKALYECADLCRKIRDDKYWDFNNSKTYKTAHKRRQKDIKTLCSLISKHLINWWD